MQTARYNPFTTAARQAWAALSCDDAIIAYDRMAWATAQRAVDDSIITATYICYAAVAAARMCAEFIEASTAPELPAPQPCLPAPSAIAFLPPAVDPAPRKRNVTAPISYDAPPMLPPTEHPAKAAIAAIKSTRPSGDRQKYWMAKTKRQLQLACQQAGITFKNGDTKRVLTSKLLKLNHQGVHIG